MFAGAMDSVSGSEGNGALRPGVQFSLASQSTWDQYYREASRRRRARGGVRESFRREKRRRRRREYLLLAASAALIGALILVAYTVLNH